MRFCSFFPLHRNLLDNQSLVYVTIWAFSVLWYTRNEDGAYRYEEQVTIFEENLSNKTNNMGDYRKLKNGWNYQKQFEFEIRIKTISKACLNLTIFHNYSLNGSNHTCLGSHSLSRTERYIPKCDFLRKTISITRRKRNGNKWSTCRTTGCCWGVENVSIFAARERVCGKLDENNSPNATRRN